MAVSYLGNQRYIGLAADTKPTNAPASAEFWETDTGVMFYYNGSAWLARDPVREATYIAYVAGSTYKVINTNTGRVDYSGSNARTVLQSALDVIKNTGRKLMIKGNYNFVLDDTLEVGSYCTVEGESWQGISQLRANGDYPAIAIDSTVQGAAIVKTHLRNLYVTHNFATFSDTTPLIDIKSGITTGTPRVIAGLRIEGCQVYDFGQNKGIGLRMQNNGAAIYKIKVDNCEFYNLNDQIYFDITTNDNNSWISQISFNSNNFWLPDGSAVRAKSIAFNGGNNMPQLINQQWVDCNCQSSSNNVGFDYETDFLGASWYNHWTNCMVWDLTGTRDAWKFNNLCEASLVNCIPTYRIGGAGATNTKIRKFGIYDRAYGTFQANGDGSTVSFIVATLMAASGGTITPQLKHVSITPLHADVQPTARTWTWASSDSSFFQVTFSTAPPSGTNNVKFSWEAMV